VRDLYVQKRESDIANGADTLEAIDGSGTLEPIDGSGTLEPIE
jgi:hypothetical protein